jgi:hypothetical protein
VPDVAEAGETTADVPPPLLPHPDISPENTIAIAAQPNPLFNTSIIIRLRKIKFNKRKISSTAHITIGFQCGKCIATDPVCQICNSIVA